MSRPVPPSEGRFRPPLVVAATALVVAGLWWALAAWAPGPPRTVVMATGPEGSAYAAFGERYRAILARSGVDLRLRPTAGAVENLARLREAASGVSVAFAQAGTAATEDSDVLASLGTVFYEPLWLFHRGLEGEGFAALRGKRMSIGPEGSGTRALAVRMLALGGIDVRSPDLLPLAPGEAAEKLSRGEIDAAAIVTSWDSPIVHKLLATPGVQLVSFPRADAHLALNPYLNKLVLPAGVADMGRNIPPSDVVLVAPKASLVVRRDLHPALQYLLLDAAVELHSPPGLFHRAGEFPAAEAIDLPLSQDAHQFYKSGRPFLQRYLPFWLAAVAERLLILLIPLVGVAYPLLRSHAPAPHPPRPRAAGEGTVGRPPLPALSVRLSVAPLVTEATAPTFQKGQRVSHAVFGAGVTTSSEGGHTVDVLSGPHTWETSPRGRNRPCRTPSSAADAETVK